MKGIVFSLEAIMAISLLIIFAIVISFIATTSFVQHQTYERFHYSSQDALELLIKSKVSYVIDKFPAIKDLKDRGILREEDLDKSLLDVIGSLWVNGSVEEARNITESILNLTIPENLGYEVSMDGTSIAKRDKPIKSLLSVSKTTVSGYAIGKPIEGYTARAYLEKILGKNTASYFYFGGFVGQGNLTAIIRDIPSDASISSIYIEGSFGSNFTLYINKSFCGVFNKTSTGYFAVDSFLITDENCLNQINKGYENETTFDFNFTGNINISYIGGGYIKVVYDTTEMTPQLVNTKRYYFPGTYGIINLYDSFYVPGNITSVKIHLEFFNKNYTFLNIGNITVFNSSGSDLLQVVDISNETISEILEEYSISYKDLSSKTVPLRMGTNLTQILMEGNADVILITDLSGSMQWRLNDSNNGIVRACDDSLLYDNTTRRISLAKCLDIEFIEIIMNNTNNRMGLVGFNNNANVFTPNLSFSKQQLINHINNTYPNSPSGGTCICCGINRAYELLNSFSDPSRKKFVVVMSDGITGYRCTPTGYCQHGPCNGTSTTGYQCCGGFQSDCTTWDGDPSSSPYTGCECAMQNANYSACRVNRDLNATVYSVGFLVVNCPTADWTFSSMAQCGNGEYYAGANAEELKNIFREIAKKIVEQSFVRQIAVISTEVYDNFLLPSSYIEFEYIPEVPPFAYGEISLKLETKPFGGTGCNGTFFVPSQLKINEIVRTSYSADFWSKSLFINNSANNWKMIWDLNDFGSDYVYLGDPFYIQFLASYIKTNENNILGLKLGVGPTTETSECSPQDRAIYTASVKSFTTYSPVFPYIEGRNITVYYDKDHDGNPDGSYAVTIGKNLPKFNSTLGIVQDLNITHNAVDYAFLKLLDQLNFIGTALPEDPLSLNRDEWPGTQNNPIDIMITPDIIFETLYVAAVPSLWGPTNLEIKVWV